MRLADVDILMALEAGRIGIDPMPQEGHVSGAAVDLSLGCRFRVFERVHRWGVIELDAPRETLQRQIDELMGDDILIQEQERFVLHPLEMALGITAESVTLPDDLCASINGRSSLARLGLTVHITAHQIDPGWSGPIVLEFFNAGRLPLALKVGMRICAISFDELSSPAIRPYHKRAGAKYRDQTEPLPSRIHRDDPAALDPEGKDHN